ncbi:MAG: MFS transporter, partial [Candidatus Goldbacteria bacterium]|nr:MFS transporter [Candidatus Goldiibacteriota bacterium]
EITYSKEERYIILVFAFFASFMATFMGSSVNIALPDIGKEFNLNAIVLSWVALSFLMTAAISNLPSGWFSDIYSKKKIILIGLIIYIFAIILTIISKTTFLLITSRVIHGLAGPLIFASSSALLVNAFPKEQRGRVLGINSAAVYLGLSTGPFFGGILAHNFGWRAIFIVVLFICVILFFYFAFKVKQDNPEKTDKKFDLIGLILYVFSIIFLIYGLSNITEAIGKIFAFIGFIGIIVFIIVENNITQPILPVKLFRENIMYMFSNIAALIHYTSTFGITFLLSLYLQYVRGLTSQNAGLIVMTQPFMMMILSPLAGRISDKIEPAYIASSGMGLTALGLLILSTINTNTELRFIVFTLAFIGIGFAFFSSPNTNAVMSSVSREFYGIASGVLGTMRLMGQMFGLAISTMMFSFFLGKSKITPSNFDMFMKSIKMLFFIFFILCVFGVLASMARGRVRK